VWKFSMYQINNIQIKIKKTIVVSFYVGNDIKSWVYI